MSLRHPFSALALCVVASLGCGGSDFTTPPAGGAGGGAGSGSAGAAGSAGAGGGIGAAGSGGAAGSSGGAALAPLDPLAVDNAWTYDVTELGTYPLCPSGSHTGKVVSKGPKDGKQDVYGVKSLCEKVGVVYYVEKGDLVEYDTMGTWAIALDEPVKEGHQWFNGVATVTWHDAGSVTVPAGTFDQCWKAAVDGADAYSIFCRGVGPVRWHLADAMGNGYDAVLTAKSF